MKTEVVEEISRQNSNFFAVIHLAQPVLHNWSFVRHTISEFFDPLGSGSCHIFRLSFYFQFVQILQRKEKTGGQSESRVVS